MRAAWNGWVSARTWRGSRFSASAAPAASPACRSPRASRRPGRARRCCSSRSRSAPWPCGMDKLTKANVVATALFGDGAAAAVLRAGDGRASRSIAGAGRAHLARHPRHHGLGRRSAGLRRRLRPRHPAFRARPVSAPPSTGCSGGSRLRSKTSTASSAIPAAPKVIEALEQALDLEQGASTTSARCCATYGNMSAPTVLFVLERVLARRPAGARAPRRHGPGLHRQPASPWTARRDRGLRASRLRHAAAPRRTRSRPPQHPRAPRPRRRRGCAGPLSA